jgi:deoxyribose-phosphate aldolase
MASNLGEAMVEAALIDAGQLLQAREEQKKQGGRLGPALLRLGLVSEDDLTNFFAQLYQLELVNLHEMALDQRVVELVPRDEALKIPCIPISRTGRALVVATSDPSGSALVEQLNKLTRHNVELVLTYAAAIRSKLEQHWARPPAAAAPSSSIEVSPTIEVAEEAQAEAPAAAALPMATAHYVIPAATMAVEPPRVAAPAAAPQAVAAPAREPAAAAEAHVPAPPAAPEAAATVRSPKELAPLLEQVLVRPDATRADVTRACEEARRHGFASVAVNSCHVALAARLLEKSEIRLVAVVGFPYGLAPAAAKALEAAEAVKSGAVEIALVAHPTALRTRDYATLTTEIAAAVQAAAPAKVRAVLEFGAFGREEKAIACALARAAGAESIATGTGGGLGGASSTPEEVALVRSILGPDVAIHAAAARTPEEAGRLLDAGATRVGLAAGCAQVMMTRRARS